MERPQDGGEEEKERCILSLVFPPRRVRPDGSLTCNNSGDVDELSNQHCPNVCRRVAAGSAGVVVWDCARHQQRRGGPSSAQDNKHCLCAKKNNRMDDVLEKFLVDTGPLDYGKGMEHN